MKDQRFSGESFRAAFPFGQVLSHDQLVNFVWQLTFAPTFTEDQPLTKIESVKRRRQVESIIRDLVKGGTLVSLSGDRYQRNPREEPPITVTFTWVDGATYTMPRGEYDEKLRELRSRTPEAIQRARIDALTQALEDLKGNQNV